MSTADPELVEVIARAIWRTRFIDDGETLRVKTPLRRQAAIVLKAISDAGYTVAR